MNDDARTISPPVDFHIHRPTQNRLTLVGGEAAPAERLLSRSAELWLPRPNGFDLPSNRPPADGNTPGPRSVDAPASYTSALSQLTSEARASVHTFGFATQAGTATLSGARWISPLLQHAVEFPSVWVKRAEEARYEPSRSRVRRLLDRLCGADPAAPALRTVVVVAHPDDEAIGAGARLSAIPETTIVHVTDGAPRDPRYAMRKGFASRDGYAQSRQDELMAALAVLGIPRERTRCLDIVDGEATEHLVEIAYRLAAVFDELRPQIAVTHPYEGGHTDHDATAFGVHLACGVLRCEGAVAPIIMEMTSYHLYCGERRVGEFLPYGDLDERTVELDSDDQQLKQRMYDCFASQRECLAAFPRDREKFRVAPRYVFTKPPHAGPLLYERVSSRFEGEQWRQNAARALQRLRGRPMAKSA